MALKKLIEFDVLMNKLSSRNVYIVNYHIFRYLFLNSFYERYIYWEKGSTKKGVNTFLVSAFGIHGKVASKDLFY